MKQKYTPAQLAAIAQAAKGKKRDKKNKSRKYGRNLKKCAEYRQRVGKPRGRGVSGNKAGRKSA